MLLKKDIETLDGPVAKTGAGKLEETEVEKTSTEINNQIVNDEVCNDT